MLEALLVKHRDRVLAKWSDYILNTYHQDTQKFLKTQKNRFANPVGASIFEGLESVYDGLIDNDEVRCDALCQALDRVVRIRVVQEFSPSQALNFLFSLKPAVREVLAKDLKQNDLAAELSEFDARVDEMALLAFDVYTSCRETIQQIRIDEIKNSTARLWERICRKYGDPDACSEAPFNDNSPR